MSYSVHVLFEGYSRLTTEGKLMEANCTCTLITGPMGPIIVDTMTAWDTDRIISALAEHKVHCDDIEYVICTHGHSDHIGNNNLFKNAKLHVVGSTASRKDKHIVKLFNQHGRFDLDKELYLVFVPGHTLVDIAVFVKTKEYGLVCITGDLFEREEDIRNPSIWVKAGTEDPVRQEHHRTIIAGLADYIIPGHGPMFKVTREIFEYFYPHETARHAARASTSRSTCD